MVDVCPNNIVIQTCSNEMVTKFTTQCCNKIVMSRLYQSCWNNMNVTFNAKFISRELDPDIFSKLLRQ